eukprot:CAMPEP_0202902256 /NCGR_PEP_ID=MMETSP1392-20130828/16752_1 /ASSEMBLY_ACC=CAM_ASM_000868 /TAXON_ID=225041 /ORGANISM="Chlamydomonas chlamydogama, Strain SAG 11-48b" /LENGTH=188 /DNA_ID=CAMNT_0049588997 /DNA_START=66 /DNA_END=632 /DNA_ORIENTATION=-
MSPALQVPTKRRRSSLSDEPSKRNTGFPHQSQGDLHKRDDVLPQHDSCTSDNSWLEALLSLPSGQPVVASTQIANVSGDYESSSDVFAFPNIRAAYGDATQDQSTLDHDGAFSELSLYDWHELNEELEILLCESTRVSSTKASTLPEFSFRRAHIPFQEGQTRVRRCSLDVMEGEATRSMFTPFAVQA